MENPKFYYKNKYILAYQINTGPFSIKDIYIYKRDLLKRFNPTYSGKTDSSNGWQLNKNIEKFYGE